MKNARKVFLETLTELAEKDDKILLIVGDVGFSYMEDFKTRFPRQFLNVCVTEQTMMCMASAMAREGFKPYVYTMVNFIAFRPYEQVRNAICMINANVKLMSVVGWTNYKFLGYSHNINQSAEGTWEDEQVLKHLPNMKFYITENVEQIRDYILIEYSRR